MHLNTSFFTYFWAEMVFLDRLPLYDIRKNKKWQKRENMKR
jgi:hypothetical protein